MVPLLADAIRAHGGLNRWKARRILMATIVTRGEFMALKGIDLGQAPQTMRVALHRQWASVEPFGKVGQRSDFTPDCVAVKSMDGKVVAMRRNPRAAFARHDLRTSWDRLHQAYFNGYALWTYLTTPFLLAMDGFGIREIEPWHEGAEVWQGLRATFPPEFASHSAEQDFYFGPDMLIRRHDYMVEIAGNFPAVQYISDPVDVDGFHFPTKRRIYMRDADLTPMRDTPMASLDLSDFRFG